MSLLLRSWFVQGWWVDGRYASGSLNGRDVDVLLGRCVDVSVLQCRSVTGLSGIQVFCWLWVCLILFEGMGT